MKEIIRKRRIIINIDCDITDEDAMRRVLHVVEGGRISISSKYEIPHYCWLTTWKDGIGVSVSTKKTKESTDSFRIFRTQNHE